MKEHEDEARKLALRYINKQILGVVGCLFAFLMINGLIITGIIGLIIYLVKRS